MSGLRYLASVVTLELDAEKCGGCGVCTTVCPHGVLATGGEKVRIVDRDACMECGACSRNCPTGALSVRSGVGCAAAVIAGALHRTEAACGCSAGPSCCEG